MSLPPPAPFTLYLRLRKTKSPKDYIVECLENCGSRLSSLTFRGVNPTGIGYFGIRHYRRSEGQGLSHKDSQALSSRLRKYNRAFLPFAAFPRHPLTIELSLGHFAEAAIQAVPSTPAPAFAWGGDLRTFGIILNPTAFRNRISEKEYQVSREHDTESPSHMQRSFD